MRPVQGVNLTDREHKANPFSFYAYLRWASPVHLVDLPDGPTGWLITRYDGNGPATLLQHPEQLGQLRSDHMMIESAVEELARFTTPIEIAPRYASEALSIFGAEIPAGALVLAVVASANRDHRRFLDPDVLDLRWHPSPHLSFSVRPLDCLAAPLARVVSQVAIAALLESAAFVLEREPSTLVWRRGLTVRGLEALPVRVLRWQP